MDFGTDGEVYSGTDPLILMAFNIVSAGVSRAAEQYQKRVDANRRNIQKRYHGIQSNTMEYHGGETERETVNEIVTERENENETVNEVVFVCNRPSLEDVTAYVKQQQLPFEASRFYDYYAARNWELKPGQPLTDWKAAARTWARNE